jgi:rare lipoprotein A
MEAISNMRTELHHNRLSPATPFAIILCLSLGACSWVPKGDMQLDVGIKDRGVASWYGEQFHGRQAANGELFDMEALTAAHRTMPLGSVVRVVNLTNGKHLYVRITDRGPYEKGRILDLSHGAAVQLGMEHEGMAHVQVEIVGERRPELMLLSEKFSDRAASLLADSRTQTDRPSPGMVSRARNFPGDLWLARRNRWALAMLSTAHPSHIPVASLILN